MSKDDRYRRYNERRGVRYPTDADWDRRYRAELEKQTVPDGVLRVGEHPQTAEQVYFDPHSLAKGLHVIGGPGTGKSNFLKHLVRQIVDVNPGTSQGVALVDPHGEVAEDILNYCISKGPPWSERFIYFDLRQRAYTPVLNPLRPEYGVPLVANSVVESITRAFGLEFMMENPLTAEAMVCTAVVLLEAGCSLAEAVYFGTNDARHMRAREKLLARTSDESVRGFWEEVNNLPALQRRMETASAGRRFNFFLRFEILKRILGQTTPGIDPGALMDEGKIAIFNLGLHETQVSQQAQRFIGALIVEQFKAATMRRKKHASKPFYLVIDEFSQFASYDTMEALAEARGFGLRLVLAHQRMDQLLMKDQDPRLMRAVLAIENKVIFGAGLVDDQMTLARQAFGSWVDPFRRKLELKSRRYRPVIRRTWLDSYADGTAETTSSMRALADSRSEREPWSTEVDSQVTRGISETAQSGSAQGTSHVAGRHETLYTDHVEYEEISSVEFMKLDEQVWMKMQEHIRQPVGQASVMQGYEREPQAAVVPEMAAVGLPAQRREAALAAMVDREPQCFLPAVRADALLAERQQDLIGAQEPYLLPDHNVRSRRPVGLGQREMQDLVPTPGAPTSPAAGRLVEPSAAPPSEGLRDRLARTLPRPERALHFLSRFEVHRSAGNWSEAILTCRQLFEVTFLEFAEHHARGKGVALAPSETKSAAAIRNYLEREGVLDSYIKDQVASLHSFQSARGAHVHVASKDDAKIMTAVMLPLLECVLDRFERSAKRQ